MSTIVLMAGGTGGHLFPAMALSEELIRRGHTIYLMTDERVQTYGENFPAREIIMVPAATLSIRNPIKLIAASATILAGIAVAFTQFGRIGADAVVAFGGYPVVPPFLAARLRGIPGLLHEQNAVMGRANRALARLASGVALSFEATRGADALTGDFTLTGNPLRDRVRETAKTLSYSAPDDDGPLRLLVVGGSQGARVFADIVPPAIATIPDIVRKRMIVTQQCRPEDLDRVATAYRELKINVELSGFFTDLPERMAASHITICRSGASTIAELTALGAPAIMIPLPGALDADQTANAAVLAAAGGGWIMQQDKVSPHSLAKQLTGLFREPQNLADASDRAKAMGQLDAVTQLADLTEKLFRARAA